MAKVMIIGAGGVGSVVAHKCAQVPEVFSEIIIASRNIEKCFKIATSVGRIPKTQMKVAELDAMDINRTIDLIRITKPNIVINVALPGQDLAIMTACLETGVPYLDTANYEPPDKAEFRYEWQWGLDNLWKHKGNLALLGCGFDPGVTNVFCAYAREHLFDRIINIDIVDCNAGNHGHPFATNFDPETNIREITQPGKFWEKGKWVEIEPIINSEGSRKEFRQFFDFPKVGPKEMFLIYHEEIQSMAENFREVERIRFWMTFGEQYLSHLRLLQNAGLTRIEPTEIENIDYVALGKILGKNDQEMKYTPEEIIGGKVIPLKILSAHLPDPASLAKNYTGKTCIGCRIEGEKDGKERKVFLYNVCDHAECYREVGSQAISYTTGVPAMIGAKMIMEGKWKEFGVRNVEEFNPDPFMHDLPIYGLPWEILIGNQVPEID
jgi:saccharopine dehydrogenase (NAD+, L-lysine forming)